MKWVGISGTWNSPSLAVETDVRREVCAILARGDGIVTGGALGVDSLATDEVLVQHAADKLRVCLPVTFAIYKSHYLKRAKEGVITLTQANKLITLLESIRALNSDAIIENTSFQECNQESYFARNTKIIELSDELYAFQVNKSVGTQDTIDKAKEAGKRVTLFTYEQ